jgi:hypothetical protein
MQRYIGLDAQAASCTLAIAVNTLTSFAAAPRSIGDRAARKTTTVSPGETLRDTEGPTPRIPTTARPATPRQVPRLP